MAKIKDYAVTIEGVDTATSVLRMPSHAAGDLLIIAFSKDTSAGGPSTPAGWTSVTSVSSTGAFGQIFAKIATSSSETVTLSYTLESSLSIVMSITGYFGTTVAEAIPTSAATSSDDTGLPLNGGTITVANNKSLIINALITDSAIAAYSLPGWVNVFAAETPVNTLAVSCTIADAGALTHVGHWGSSQDDSRSMIIEIRDGSSGSIIAPYIDRSVTPSSIVAQMAAQGVADRGSWQGAASVQLLTIAGKTVTGVAGVSVADGGVNPYASGIRHTAPLSKTGLGASQLNLTVTEDMTVNGGFLFGTYRISAIRDYLDMGSAADGGVFIRLIDTTDNNKAWVVGGQFTETSRTVDRVNYLIQLPQATNTAWHVSGSLNNNLINRIQIGGSGYYGASLNDWACLFLINQTVLAGGGSASPLTIYDVENTVNNGNGLIPLVKLNGTSATLWTRVKFGGNEPIFTDISNSSIMFPTRADGTRYVDFHVDHGAIGIEFHGTNAADQLKFTNTTFASETQFYWKFNAAHSANTIVDFSGSSVTNALVTLQSTVSLDRVSFEKCSSFIQNGAVLTNCLFSNTKVVASNPSNISGSKFISSGTHGIEITTAGTYTSPNNTFVGFGVDGSDSAAIYNNSGGAVVLNVSETVTVKNGAGASTTINIISSGGGGGDPTIIINSNIDLTGAEIRIYDLNNTPAGSLGTELFGTESAVGSTYSFTTAAANEIWIQILKTGYVEFGQSYTIPASSSTFTAILTPDTNA